MSQKEMSERKKQLAGMFKENVDLMVAHRKLIQEFHYLYMVEPNSKERKQISLILLSDCLVIAYIHQQSLDKLEFFKST